MLKSNKGFMLVEVVIVATVVLTTMGFLYVSFNKLYNNYKTRNSYYNIDAMYVTKEMLDLMIERNLGNINKFISNYLSSTNNYAYIIGMLTVDDETADNEKKVKCNYNTPSNCESLREIYGIENMIMVKYELEVLKELKNITLNQTFDDYIDYLVTYYDLEENNDDLEYSYMVLTEIKDEGNHYYANLRVR